MTDSSGLCPPGGDCETQARHFCPKVNSQDARAGGTDEGAHCHVDIGRAALVAVEAFPIRGQASHFPEHLQMSLLLLSLRARRHGRKQQDGITGGEVFVKGPGTGRVPSGQTCSVRRRWPGRHLAERSSRETGRLTNYFFCGEKVTHRAASQAQAPSVGLEWCLVLWWKSTLLTGNISEITVEK